MTFQQKIEAIKDIPCAMNSSKLLCIEDAKTLFAKQEFEYADKRLEKAAQYCLGFGRPTGWTTTSTKESN